MVAVTKNKKGDEIKKIFISETTGLIGRKVMTKAKKAKNKKGVHIISYPW
jgi:hypothetical protein